MSASKDDHALLRDYVERRDEAAFAELVARHADMVYAAALRQVRKGALADDVTQAVFILLARKAAHISDGIVLAAWLHKATRYTALNAMKIEHRRREHERRAAEELAAAVRLREPAGANASINWTQGAVLLDEGVARLARKDREAIVLRFLECRSFAEVGKAMGVSEEAAQMRVSRAVEKLRVFFRRSGLAVSAATLRAAVDANAIVPAPAILKMSLAPAALRLIRPEGFAGPDLSAIESLANEAARSMKLAAIRSSVLMSSGGIAAAVVVLLLLLPWLRGGPVSAPSATSPDARPSARPADDGSPRAAIGPSDDSLELWASQPFVAMARRVDEIIAP